MTDNDFQDYWLGVNLAPGGTGICAVDVNKAGRPHRLRGLSVRAAPRPARSAAGTAESLVRELSDLLADVATEQGRPTKVLISDARDERQPGLDISLLSQFAGDTVMFRDVSRPQVADCLLEWKLVKNAVFAGQDMNARRVAIQAFATAVSGVPMVDPESKQLRRALPESLRRLVAIEPARGPAPCAPSLARRHLDIFEHADGRWGTGGAGTAPVMRLFEHDLLMVGFGSDQQILRVVRWGSRSNTLWLAPSTELGNLRQRHHDAADPLRCSFVPIGRLKSLSARRVTVDQVGRVLKANAADNATAT